MDNGNAANPAERRRQHRDDQREAILEKARAVAEGEGWEAVTVRRIAEEIAYTPPVLYQHFKDKQGLLVALMDVGFGELAAALRDAGGGGKDWRRRVMAMAEASWTYAFAHPQMYQLMHGLGGVPFGTAQAPENAREAFAVVREALPGEIAARERDAAVESFWALVHGWIALTMAGRTRGGERRARPLMQRSVQWMATMLVGA